MFEFRRYKKLHFSDTSLFKEIKSQSQTKNQLRHLLLLATRLLFLTFLILAFAKPIIPSSDGKKIEPELISVYVDNSYSMSSSDAGGAKMLTQALEIAFRISEQYPKEYKFQLLTNALTANEKRILNKKDFIEQLDNISTIAQHRPLEEILVFQQRSVAEEDVSRMVTYLISDFNQLLPKEESPLTVDSNNTLRLIPMQPMISENLSIDSAWSFAPIVQKGIEQKIGFRITNHGNQSILDQKIDVFIGDKQVYSPIVSIGPNDYIDTSFTFTPNETGRIKGRISLEDRAIIFDDTYFFSIPVKSKIAVAELSQNLKADSPFKRLFTSDQFTHVQQEPSALVQDELEKSSLLVINELNSWNTGLTAVAASHLDKGGNLLIVTATQFDETFREALRLNYGFELKEADTVNGNLTDLNPDQPLFYDVFEKMDSDMNLPFVSKCYGINNTGSLEKVLELPNNRLLLAAYPVSNGKVYLLTAPLSAAWTNLASHAVFVPLMINMAAKSGLQEPLAYPLDVKMIPWAGAGVEKIQLTATDHQESIFPSISYKGLHLQNALKHPGIYAIEGYNPDTVFGSVAFNYNRKESRLEYPGLERLASSFKGDGDIAVLNAQDLDIAQAIMEADLGKVLWPYFILLALLFFLIEILLLKSLPL